MAPLNSSGWNGSKEGDLPSDHPHAKASAVLSLIRWSARALVATVKTELAPEGLRWTLQMPASEARAPA